MTDASEKEKTLGEILGDKKINQLADTVIEYAAGAIEIVELVRKMAVMDVGIAFGSLYLAFQTLRKDYPQYAEKLGAITEFIDTVLNGQTGDELMRRMAQMRRERESEDMEVLNAILVLPKFKLGQVTISNSAKLAAGPECVGAALRNHGDGNWGPFLSPDERKRNDENMGKSDGKIYSVHRINPKKEDGPDNKIYIITEPDRSATRIITARDE